MAVPKGIAALKGSWRGKSKLNLPDESDAENVTESDSELRVDTDGLDTYATITYTWEYEGQAQQGSLILAGSEKDDTVSGGWADSWHQNGSILALTGTGMSGDFVSLSAKYFEVWGWRIEIGAEKDTLVVRMTNIDPEGAETWAVLGEYRKSPKPS